jgi:hypothetical protein
MADKKFTDRNVDAKQLKDMGDGTFAEAIYARSPPALDLMINGVAAGWVGPFAGGTYIWSCQQRSGGSFNSATIALKYLARDGVSGVTCVKADGSGATTMTGAGSMLVQVGEGAYLQVAATGGVPAGIDSNVS